MLFPKIIDYRSVFIEEFIFVSVNRNSEYRNYANFAKRYGAAVTIYYKVKTTFMPLTNFRLLI